MKNKNLLKLIIEVNAGFSSITIVNNKGKNAVLISEEKWKSIEETLYLSNVPGLANNINNIRKKNICLSEKYYFETNEIMADLSNRIFLKSNVLTNRNELLIRNGCF